MIGNRGYATFIRDWVRDEQKVQRIGGYSCPNSAPPGWKYIGQGCYRAAYLSPDGVVYKVQNDGRYSYQSNAGEAKKYRTLYLTRRVPEGARLPLLRNFVIEGADTVNAMDFVGPTLSKYDGPDYQKYSAVVRLLAWELRIGDMHHGNVAVDEKLGLVVPIDLGM